MTAPGAAPRVAFIGLGVMGSGMARRVLRAGFPLAVHNRTARRANPLVAKGARRAATPADAASGADVVISMVADDDASRTVWLGPRGALAGAAPGAVLIETSTLSPDWVVDLAAAARERQCELLDAPVTGSKAQASQGKLKFLVGGSAAALERARPVLAVMSKAIVHLGPTGSGALLKLINNFLGGVQAASAAEALALIERSGLDRTQALDVLVNGAPGSPLVETMLGRMTAEDYTTNFALALMQKDLTYAVEAAARAGVDLSMARAAREAYQRANDAGLGAEDFSAVVKPIRRPA